METEPTSVVSKKRMMVSGTSKRVQPPTTFDRILGTVGAGQSHKKRRDAQPDSEAK